MLLGCLEICEVVIALEEVWIISGETPDSTTKQVYVVRIYKAARLFRVGFTCFRV